MSTDLARLARAILSDKAAAPVAALAAARLTILNDEEPLRSLVNEATGRDAPRPASQIAPPPDKEKDRSACSP